MIKYFLAMLTLVVSTAPALAADASVSITVGQPGFYGRIDIIDYPQPRLLYPEPLLVQSAPVDTAAQPLYLYAPAKHAKDWRKHCKKYNACGQPVYFVQENWYKEVYVPEYRARKDVKEGKKKDENPKKQKKE